jgi:hypothetical protein
MSQTFNLEAWLRVELQKLTAQARGPASAPNSRPGMVREENSRRGNLLPRRNTPA